VVKVAGVGAFADARETVATLAIRTQIGVLRSELVTSSAPFSTSATQVLLWRDSLKVFRVAASRVAAQVVDLQAIGDGADERLVGGAVAVHATSQASVAAVVHMALPLPAPRLGNSDFGEDYLAVWWWLGQIERTEIGHALVVEAAQLLAAVDRLAGAARGPAGGWSQAPDPLERVAPSPVRMVVALAPSEASHLC
jgi:hypothetical protein